MECRLKRPTVAVGFLAFKSSLVPSLKEPGFCDDTARKNSDACESCNRLGGFDLQLPRCVHYRCCREKSGEIVLELKSNSARCISECSSRNGYAEYELICGEF